MDTREKKGVTLIVLIITIIVLVILASITIRTSSDLLRNSRRNKMKTMLFMVKSRAEVLLDDYLFDIDGKNWNEEDNNSEWVDFIENKLGGTYIDNVSLLKRVGFEQNSNSVPSKNNIIYCSWDENVLNSQGIDTKNFASKDVIIVQYVIDSTDENIESHSVEVATLEGFKDENQKIYKLIDF